MYTDCPSKSHTLIQVAYAYPSRFQVITISELFEHFSAFSKSAPKPKVYLRLSVPKKCKMTILSNHRLHSYKATTAKYCRIINRKSTPMKAYQQNTKYSTQNIVELFMNKNKAGVKKEEHIQQTHTQQKESAPLVMALTGHNVYEDIYGWYPIIYDSMHAEDQKYESIEEENVYEEMWDHLDYLEYMCD